MVNKRQAVVLTREELADITGTVQPKRMADWLKNRGWTYEPASGRGDYPKVSREYYEARMSGQVGGRRRDEEPWFDFMRKGK